MMKVQRQGFYISGLHGTLRSSLIPRPHERRKSGLLSTACICTIFPEYSRKIVSFTQLVHVDHTQTEYSRSNPCTRTHPQGGCKAFLYNLSFRSATQAFHCSLQRGGMARRFVFSSTQVLLVPVENGDSLPIHSCHSCVGKLERLERYLKDLRSGLTQRQQVPDNLMHIKRFLTCCLSMVRK